VQICVWLQHTQTWEQAPRREGLNTLVSWAERRAQHRGPAGSSFLPSPPPFFLFLFVVWCTMLHVSCQGAAERDEGPSPDGGKPGGRDHMLSTRVPLVHATFRTCRKDHHHLRKIAFFSQHLFWGGLVITFANAPRARHIY
jgi:hypothetical protein